MLLRGARHAGGARDRGTPDGCDTDAFARADDDLDPCGDPAAGGRRADDAVESGDDHQHSGTHLDHDSSADDHDDQDDDHHL